LALAVPDRADGKEGPAQHGAEDVAVKNPPARDRVAGRAWRRPARPLPSHGGEPTRHACRLAAPISTVPPGGLRAASTRPRAARARTTRGASSPADVTGVADEPV